MRAAPVGGNLAQTEEVAASSDMAMGRGRPTLHQVADRAGVSIATVSRVFQGTTQTSESARARVVEAASLLGYEPPRRRRVPDRRHQAYGIVLPGAGTDISELVLGCGESASRQGRSVSVVVALRGQETTAAVRALVDCVDGLVVVGASLADPVILSLSRKLPVVLVGRPGLPGCDAVCAEDTSAAQRMTEHLLQAHQRQHLVFVGDPDSSPEVAERYRGFRLAHATVNLPLRRPPLRVPLVEAAGVQVAEEILRRRVRIDGVVCASDELAMSIMSRLLDGRVDVPADMAVVGWGDILASRHLRPALTTVRQPVRRMGRAAADLLHRRVAGHAADPESHQVPSELLIRSSCGCAEPVRPVEALSALPRR